jgi:hypothetical protein
MMAVAPRVVAELGRPETPDETAARKAESSRVYRSSQTVRNLIAALLATLAVVLVVVVAVPRGNPPAAAAIDVAAVAKEASSAYGRTVLVPDVPSSWRVNSAAVSGDDVETWTVVYATGATGYLRVSQGFDADAAWEARMLSGAGSDGTVTIDGIAWTRYAIADPAQAGNVDYAIGTQAGADRILIYGMTDAATAAEVASGLSDQIRDLREETP